MLKYLNSFIINRYSLPIFVLLFGVFISCSRQEKKTSLILRQTEAIVEQNPDSALSLLETIPFPYRPDKGQDYEYILRWVQSKDKAGKEIASDTLILRAKEYFERVNAPNRTALSCFYCGRVWQSQGEPERAMQFFLMAKTAAQNMSDMNTKGLIHYYIGILHYEQDHHEEAIEQFKQSNLFFGLVPDGYKKQISAYNLTGNCFLIESRNDSAFHYFQKGLNLARQHNDSTFLSIVMQNLGVYYRETGRYTLSEESLKSAISFQKDSASQVPLYLNLIEVYNRMGETDSAQYYADKLRNRIHIEKDGDLLLNVYNSLFSLEYNKGDYKQAVAYQSLYTDALASIFKEKEKVHLLEVLKKYDYKQIENEKARLYIHRQRALIALLFLSVAIIGTYFFFYRRNTKNKAIQYEKDIALLEAEEKISKLNDLADSLNQTEATLRTLVLEHFDILKKANALARHLKDDQGLTGVDFIKKINDVLYGEEETNWDKLFQVMNESYEGFFPKIKERYRDLTETEYRICCLTYAGLDNTEIGLILRLSKNTITQKKADIRRKLGIEERGDIVAFLDNH